VCQHVVRDDLCDRGTCMLAACRPGDPAADARGCVAQPAGEGAPCTADVATCTDDRCAAGVCLHTPIDAACAGTGPCRAATCAPARAGADFNGCVAGPVLPDGATCPDDGTPCTADVCRGGACVHEASLDAASCSALDPPFRTAEGLAGVAADMAVLVPANGSRAAARLAARIGRVVDDLDAVGPALASGVSPVGVAPMIRLADATPGIPVRLRAHIALVHVLRTPRALRGFLEQLSLARQRAGITRDVAKLLRQRGRVLLRATHRLGRDLRRLARAG